MSRRVSQPMLRLISQPASRQTAQRANPRAAGGDRPGDHRAHAPLLVWVQTVAFPSTQEHGYAELGWKVLAKLLASQLATKTDSDVIQVIAEHAALGEQATDEGGPSVGSEGDA
jgi:hypothetical protein